MRPAPSAGAIELHFAYFEQRKLRGVGREDALPDSRKAAVRELPPVRLARQPHRLILVGVRAGIARRHESHRLTAVAPDELRRHPHQVARILGLLELDMP